MLVFGIPTVLWPPPPSPSPESEQDCSFPEFCLPPPPNHESEHECSLSGFQLFSLAALTISPTPKRAFVLVSGFWLPSACYHHHPTPKASPLCSFSGFRLFSGCPYHPSNPETSTNARFGVLAALCLLPPPSPEGEPFVLVLRVPTVLWSHPNPKTRIRPHSGVLTALYLQG